jgi:hypothetical protein
MGPEADRRTLSGQSEGHEKQWGTTLELMVA